MEAVWQRKRWACFFAAWCLIVAAWLMGAPAEARTTISFWHDWGGLGGQFFEAMVEEFEREHPEIDVEIVYAGDLENKATVAIAAGASPDVIFFPRFITGKWAARSMLEPLTRFVAEKGIREEYFFPATWEEVVYHGEVWGVPFNTDARVLFYNKAVFLESGLDPEAPPRDWNDLVSYSHQVTRRRADGALERVGFVPVWGNQSLLMYIWQNGGDMFDADRTKVLLDSREAVGALEWVDAFVEYYGWQSLQQFSSEFGDAERTPWFTGQIAMITEGNWNLHGLKEFAPYFFENELGVAPLPGNVTRATVAGGFSLAIPYGAPHVKEAETFIEWAARPENQLAFAVATGVIPADRRAGRDPYFVEDFFWGPFIHALDTYARPRPAHPAYPEIEALMFDAVRQALNKEQTVRTALEDAARRGQAILDRYNAVFGW